MKTSLIFIVAVFVTQTSRAADDDLSYKKNKYKDSCQQTMMRLLLDKAIDHELESKPQMAMFAIKGCRDLMDAFDKANSWTKVKTPDFDACVDAVHVLVDPKQGDANERKIRARYCADKMRL